MYIADLEEAFTVTGCSLIMFPVSNLKSATTLYRTLLGTAPYVEQDYYVGFRLGELEVGLDPQGHQRGSTGALAYWSVDDAAASLQALIDAGAEKVQDATDIGYGKTIAIAKDADGSLIGLLQAPK